MLLPEAEDDRVLSAAAFLKRWGGARPVLVGEPGAVRERARTGGFDVEGLEILDPAADPRRTAYAEKLFEAKRDKGVTRDQAEALMKAPLYFSAFALGEGRADALVAGAAHTTADTVRAAFAGVGLDRSTGAAFGAFFMEFPHAAGGIRRLLFADAAVSIHPSPRALAAAGVASAALWKRLTGEDPRVAFLSFSTRGSAADPAVDAVREAVALAREKAPGLAVDGELQADAALVLDIARQKGAGDSDVSGRANVLIFPDLNAGNVAYKIAQHLGGARAAGPLLLGLKKPASDLSRGCNDEDIVDTTALVSLL